MNRREFIRNATIVAVGATMIPSCMMEDSEKTKPTSSEQKKTSPKRIVFYFTATGNSLYVARALSSDTISIPQALKGEQLEYEADEIGFVFPDFAAMAPLIVRDFIQKAHLKASYFFSVITFGNAAVNVTDWWNGFCREHGITNDYVNTLLMVDNYLPVFDMNEQRRIDKHIEDNLSAIVSDVNARKNYVATAGAQAMGMQGFLSNIQNTIFTMTSERLLNLNASACVGCGTCAKVCPRGNFRIESGLPKFSGKCEYCLACVHACPAMALTLAGGERNARARFRNENIPLADIIKSNNQQ